MNDQEESSISKKKHLEQILAQNSSKNHWIRVAYFLLFFLGWLGAILYLLIRKVIPRSKKK